MVRKYFLAKLFVPLIKGSVSPQFYVIFGKLNFWRNIDRRRPYKMVKIWTISICAKKVFLAKLFIWLIKRSVSQQFYAIFWILNFWRGIDRRGPFKNGENLNYLKLSKEIIFWQNYLFHSSKVVFLHNFTQFLENWIFEGISTGAHLTKWWKFELSQFVLRKCFLAKLFVPLIKGSVSPQFYAIFGKLNFWRNIDRRDPLQKWWIFELS